MKHPVFATSPVAMTTLVMMVVALAASLGLVAAARDTPGRCKESFCRRLCVAWRHLTGVCLEFWPYRDEKRCHCSDVWFRSPKRGRAIGRFSDRHVFRLVTPPQLVQRRIQR
ncbi:uncharacterized protein LOC125945542 [Dermacentor silvarum]|uniref:uncharacterized protein LOC125945542 n=1 Tax=Dermacentor silvarum TaxID=543639 RepID=UPI002101C3EC|nr:uncharacterized protein LOC125945542 [Dermacentor silvarum]